MEFLGYWIFIIAIIAPILIALSCVFFEWKEEFFRYILALLILGSGVTSLFSIIWATLKNQAIGILSIAEIVKSSSYWSIVLDFSILNLTIFTVYSFSFLPLFNANKQELLNKQSLFSVVLLMLSYAIVALCIFTKGPVMPIVCLVAIFVLTHYWSREKSDSGLPAFYRALGSLCLFLCLFALVYLSGITQNSALTFFSLGLIVVFIKTDRLCLSWEALAIDISLLVGILSFLNKINITQADDSFVFPMVVILLLGALFEFLLALAESRQPNAVAKNLNAMFLFFAAVSYGAFFIPQRYTISVLAADIISITFIFGCLSYRIDQNLKIKESYFPTVAALFFILIVSAVPGSLKYLFLTEVIKTDLTLGVLYILANIFLIASLLRIFLKTKWVEILSENKRNSTATYWWIWLSPIFISLVLEPFYFGSFWGYHQIILNWTGIDFFSSHSIDYLQSIGLGNINLI